MVQWQGGVTPPVSEGDSWALERRCCAASRTTYHILKKESALKADSFYFFNCQLNVFAEGDILNPHHLGVTLIHRYKYLFGGTLAHGLSHGRGYLAPKGIGQDYAQGANDHISVSAVDQDRVLPGGTTVCTSFEHGGGGDAIGAQGQDTELRQTLFQLLDDGLTNLAALAINDYCLHGNHLPI